MTNIPTREGGKNREKEKKQEEWGIEIKK